jgi:hypothetical protein
MCRLVYESREGLGANLSYINSPFSCLHLRKSASIRGWSSPLFASIRGWYWRLGA